MKRKRLAFLFPLALVACESQEPPAACGPIPQVTVNAGETASVTACFNDPNGDALAYSATSSSPGVATASVSGADITVAAVAPGSATVTVIASDPGGLKAEQRFQVMVPNRAPQPRGAMPSITVPVDRAETVDASSYFSEPDGETLSYSATSSNAATATVAVAGSTVTVTALAKGTTNVVVTARDPGGLTATQTFEVTVPNRAPVAGDPIPDTEVFVGDSESFDASEHFSDPDGDALAYAASTSDARTARVSVSGSTVRVEAVRQGSATVTVTATDPEGRSAESSFEVTVPNRAPVAGDPIPDAEVFVGNATEVDASEHFSDPDGDALSYSASSSDRSVARVSVSRSTVTVEGESRGSATVTVTATDPGGLSAQQVFRATVTNPDREVLVKLYHATDGPNWVNNDGWLNDAPLDEWYGVSTDASGRVVALDLTDVVMTTVVGNGLRGSIPPELGMLTRLEYLDLYGNDDLTGQIPLELGSLANLRYLGLGNNRLSGGIPPELGKLARLEQLTVFGNGLRGPIPPELGNLANLRYLSLGGNPLTGTIPPELGSLTNLRGMTLHNNRLSGSIPRELGDLSNLEILWLNGNSLTGLIPRELGDLSNLRTLRLDRNSLSGTIPSELGDLSNLERLWLNGNSLSGSIPPELGDLTALWLLHVSHNELSGPIPPELGNLSVLEEMRINSNPALSDTIPLEYRKLPLTVFWWDDTGLCSPDDSSFQAWLDSIEDHHGGPVCRENRPPRPVGTIPNQTLTEDDTMSLDVEDYFSDPDGDELTYSVESSRPSVATASMSGSTVTVVAVAPGTATITVTATDPGDLSATQTFRVTVSASESFDLEMHFTSSVSSTVRSRVADARDEWEAVLEDTELDDITVNRTLSCHGISRFVGTVDDHLIFVHVDSIDGEGGILAYAGFCYRRVADNSPLLSATWIDEADVEEMIDEDALVPVMFHEMAHALGFTRAHWERLDLLDKGDDPHFEGELAIEAFDEAGGDDYDGEKVPVQLRVYSHWRESVFGDEIMTPVIDLENDEAPISAITLQAMADAGYEVDVSRADDYELPGSDDIRSRRSTGRVFDLSNDVVWGPVTVLDAEGRVVRVIPPPPGSVRWPPPGREVHIAPGRGPRSERTPPDAGSRPR